ncbi:MAG: SPFH domain-containing protein [Pirellulaceae bacterium]
MFGIGYLKTPPTTYVIQYSGGRITRQGGGASFFYFTPTTTLVSVPLASVDVPFVFQEVTADFQEVTLQGQLTYRVADPLKLSQLMNYTVDGRGRYVSDDPTKLNDRLIQLAQVGAHEFAQRERLESLLPRCAELGMEMLKGLRSSEVTSMLGLEILSLSILSAKPTPEMAKAMQAEAREQLLGRADQAMFARRNTAIELERQIKENELNTERAVEEKRREVRQAQMQADVAIEQQRAELVDQQVANNRKLAEAQNDALRATLEAMRSVDWKTLSAAMGSGDARGLIAMAFQQLAENANKIGRLDISPDLLTRLLDEQRSDQE